MRVSPGFLVGLLGITVVVVTAPVSGASVAPDGMPEIVGRTYEIAEPDLLDEIAERAARADWSAVARDLATPPAGEVAHLPSTRSPSIRHHVPWYVVPFDVPDGRGGVLYPKGFRFNPLKHVSLVGGGDLIVIDDSDASLAWLASRAMPRWLLVAGDARRVSTATGQPAYALSSVHAARLGLTSVPSVVTQEATRLRIETFVIEEGAP